MARPDPQDSRSVQDREGDTVGAGALVLLRRSSCGGVRVGPWAVPVSELHITVFGIGFTLNNRDNLHLSLNERVASDRLDILSGHVFESTRSSIIY